MRSTLTRVGPTAVGVAGRYGLGALFRTLRIEKTGHQLLLRPREERTPVIFVFWHGRLLPLIHVHRHQGVVVLVSEHRDGEYLARLLHHFGFGTVRGSSTRGGARGLKGLVRAASGGWDLAITPDGPRGPNRELKLGALSVARLTGLPLVPVGVGVASAWRVRSWDGLLVPKPFATVRVAYGPPSFVPRNAGQAEIDEMAASLQRRLGDLSGQVGDTAPLGEVEDAEPLSEVEDAEPLSEVEDAEPLCEVEDAEPLSEAEDAEPPGEVKDTVSLTEATDPELSDPFRYTGHS